MKERREFKTITKPVFFQHLLHHFYILHAITTKLNLYDLATFSIIYTFQLVTIFVSLGHNHFIIKWLQKIDIKYVYGTILTFSVVSQKLLAVINLKMLSAHRAIPFWAIVP